MKKKFLYWGFDSPATIATIEEIDHFDARGMLRVYGRGDHFDSYHNFNMDIWLTRAGRLLMRCWSRCEDIDWRSFEINGLEPSQIPRPVKGEGLQESWLPEVVRNAYEEWVTEEW